MAAPGRYSCAVLVAAALLLGTVTVRVQAGDGVRAPVAEDASTPSPRSLSLDQAVRLIEQRYRGRVVRAETEQDAGRTLYLLRVLDEGGHVWSVRVDADSGAVL